MNRTLVSLLLLAALPLTLTHPVTAAAGKAAPAAARSVDGTVTGEILLKLTSTSALQPLLAKYPLTVLDSFGARPLYRVKVIGRTSVALLLRKLRLEPTVQIAEPNAFHQNPEARKNQFWAIGSEVEYRSQWAPQAMNLAAAQALSTGVGIRVAVLDTGVDLQHPALAGRLLPGHDFVDNDDDPSEVGNDANKGFGHGTHVAGLVALAAPGAMIMPLRVLDPEGSGTVWSLARAMLYAVDPDGNPQTDDGAQVINLSLGTLNKTNLFQTLSQIVSCNPPDVDPLHDLSDPGYDDDKARCLAGNGAFVVAAAGNGGSSKEKQYPAAEGAYGLLPVGASDASGHLAAFSNFGSWVNTAAPGDGITSTVPGGGYATWSGTSMAAPLAAGAAALLRARDPAITPKDLVRRIERSSALLCGAKTRQIDALAALNDTQPPDIVCP